jgi:hypothetical protein
LANERYLLRTLVVRRSALKPIGKFWSGKVAAAVPAFDMPISSVADEECIVKLGKIARTRPALSDG